MKKKERVKSDIYSLTKIKGAVSRYFLLFFPASLFTSSEIKHVDEILTRGTKRLVSVNICSVEGNLADIFVSKVLPGIFVMKVK